MANHDPHEVPDVTISGALALEVMELLMWAEFRATPAEDVAREQIHGARVALDGECTRSWFRQRHAMGAKA